MSLAASGCDLFDFLNQDVELPIDLTSPPTDVDVDGPIGEAEGTACSTADSPSCIALTAICQSEAGRDCTDPSMPDEFPGTVDLPAGGTADANQLMEDMGVTEASEIEVALPVDVAAALADEGVQTPDAVKDVRIDAVVLQWPENTLTFDAPLIDLYIAEGDVGSGPVDAEELIAAGTITKVGTIGIDVDGDGTLDVSQVAGETTDAPVEFVAGGNEAFNEAVKSASFTLVTAVPEGSGLALKQKAGDPDTVLKPGGQAQLQLKATLVYSVSAADIIGQAQ
ncbi:MAG: hypothetical protein A2138_09970 [Deltaproteobacteria bacterium RBG_16_71_12]|nr:MAG: hypothetical protein A2138_09970 [Deltaproteobacteria bacterium RBG_16_71_12]